MFTSQIKVIKAHSASPYAWNLHVKKEFLLQYEEFTKLKKNNNSDPKTSILSPEKE